MRWAVALHRLPGRLIQSCINPRASFPNDLDTPQKSIRGQRSAIVNIEQYQMSGTGAVNRAPCSALGARRGYGNKMHGTRKGDISSITVYQLDLTVG